MPTVRRLAALAVLAATLTTASADPVPGQPAAAPLVDWVLGLQWTDGSAAGALALDAGPSFYLDGQGYQRVVPYFSNLAVAALLDAAPSAQTLALAERWMEWSLANVGPEGVPTEWWVSTDGTRATACPTGLPTTPAVDRCDHVDATDSAAATLLDVARAYAEAGGDPSRLRRWRKGLRGVGKVLRTLQDADGLTWARADYPVKYLMDNAETVRGFRALAVVERRVGRERAARNADRRALRAEAGLASMRDPATGLWAWARHGDGSDEVSDLDRWYADALAQVWPLLFDAAPDFVAVDGFWTVDAAYDGTLRPDWATTRDPFGFERSAVAVAAARAGDYSRAREHVDSVWDRTVAPVGGAPFVGPFTVADAGWLLRAVVETEAAASPPLAAFSTVDVPALTVSAPVPNPTPGAATLEVAVGSEGEVLLEVVDLRGRLVRTPTRTWLAEGATQRVRVETAGLAPGVYVARVVSGAEVATVRLTVVR